MNIPRNQTICNYCNLKEIEDAFNYILKCEDSPLKEERKSFFESKSKTSTSSALSKL
jgi:hypothetical protein